MSVKRELSADVTTAVRGSGVHMRFDGHLLVSRTMLGVGVDGFEGVHGVYGVDRGNGINGPNGAMAIKVP